MVSLAQREVKGQTVTICRNDTLKECEEPDVGKLLVRFCEGLGYNFDMVEIAWHRRETSR